MSSPPRCTHIGCKYNWIIKLQLKIIKCNLVCAWTFMRIFFQTFCFVDCDCKSQTHILIIKQFHITIKNCNQPSQLQLYLLQMYKINIENYQVQINLCIKICSRNVQRLLQVLSLLLLFDYQCNKCIQYEVSKHIYHKFIADPSNFFIQ